MKNLSLFLLIFLSQICFSQSKINSVIDDLKTETEVQNFVQSLSKNGDNHLAKFELKKIKNFDDNNVSQILKRTADSLQIDQSFYKGDFDHNGKTDILFIGDDKSCNSSQRNADGTNSCDTSVRVAFDLGNSIEVKNLLPNHFDFIVPIIRKINDQEYIEVFYDEITEDMNSDSLKYNHQLKSKILTHKFDNFVEYNRNPTNYKIHKIKFSTGVCFGGCPVFSLEVDKNEDSKFYAEYYNFDRSKKNKKFKKEDKNFAAKINPEDFLQIVEILNYLNFSELKDDYKVNGDDFQSSTLSIEYGIGEKKIIRDYGLVGTYGLKLLYKKLFDLRFNQNWKKSKK